MAGDAKEEDSEALRISRDLLNGFLQAVLDIQRFAEITLDAVRRLAAGVPLMEAVDAYQAPSLDEGQRARAQAHLAAYKENVEFVKANRARHESSILGQAVVSSWGALEAHIDDVLVALVAADKTLLSGGSIPTTKVPLAQFEACSSAERVEFLIDVIKSNLNARFKRGAGQFESVLEVFGLGGALEEPLRRNFIEFSAVRNVIAHRRSIVDRRFTEACPWLGLEPGSTMQVTKKTLTTCVASAMFYATVFQQRIEAKYGRADDPDLAALLLSVRAVMADSEL